MKCLIVRLASIACVFLMLLGCTKSDAVDEVIVSQTNTQETTIEEPSTHPDVFQSTIPNSTKEVDLSQFIIKHSYATAQEGLNLKLSNNNFFAGMSQHDIDYRLQKVGGTLEELYVFIEQQILDFTQEEIIAVDCSFERIQKRLQDNGYVLPELGHITLIKTTMKEECGAAAYTHGTHIYFGESILSYATHEDESYKQVFDELLCHEIFHCLTRNNPQFRIEMYDCIGFTVHENDFIMGDNLKELCISNPDVEHHNASTTFLIDGEETECYMALITTKPFKNKGDTFFSSMIIALIPVDNPNTFYTIEDASNFWNVFGRNTDYVLDPEECLADNFSFVIMYGENSFGSELYATPSLIHAIAEVLKPDIS